MSLILRDLRAKQQLFSRHGQSCSLLKAIVSDGTLAGVLFRAQSALVRWHLAPLALVPHVLNKWLNGCVIGIRAQFGAGFVMCHPVGVVINSSVRGGRNIWLESGVVLGENRGRLPRLGDDIYIGAGAKLIGGLVVGSGVRSAPMPCCWRTLPTASWWSGFRLPGSSEPGPVSRPTR